MALAHVVMDGICECGHRYDVVVTLETVRPSECPACGLPMDYDDEFRLKDAAWDEIQQQLSNGRKIR